MTDRADSPQFTALDAGRGKEHGNEDVCEDIHGRLDRLESLVEQQQETIDRQRERIEALRAERDVAAGDSDAKIGRAHV